MDGVWTGPDPSPGGFWQRLEQARAEIDRPEPSPVAVTAIVGPLAATIPAIRQISSRRKAGECAVVVLTRRAEIISEPTWELVRDGSRLFQVAAARPQRSALLVVDAGPDLPVWAGPLLARLRTAGAGLVRLAVPGDPTDEELARCRRLLGEPLLIDLLHTVGPARILELIDRGEPVASVAGVPVSGELLLAMRAEMDSG